MVDRAWHTQLQMYVVYPDAFCTDGSCTLDQLIDQLPRIKQLGCNAIHVLPPFESPMIDKGFDVSDYYTIHPRYGGDKAFDRLLTETKKHNMHVFIDFVLNHISDQHEWFQKAITGDNYYKEFFITSNEPPLFEGIYKENDVTFARYHINNQIKDIRVVFPDQTGKIPHWVEHNGTWYYHTFYPQQIDLDWNNPQVSEEMGKILSYWAQKGCNFRLDAVPHVGKRWEDGMRPNTANTHTIVHTLRETLQQMNPNCIFLLEVSADIETVVPYFGNINQREADLAYTFELTEKLWIALLLKDIDPIWQILNKMTTIPDYAQWVTFLRNHDGLSLKYCDERTRKRIFETLPEDNEPFHYGYGTSGRTLSLLHNDPKRTIIAHLLLASLPGNPALIYGDEIGKTNDIAYMKEQTQLKLAEGVHAEDDTRDIARGQITGHDLNQANGLHIQDILKTIFTTRADYPDLSTTYPKRIDVSHNGIFATSYQLDAGELYVYINLTSKQIEIETTIFDPILTIHDVTLGRGIITLGAYSGLWMLGY